jgi:hypothetical protein
MGPPSYMWSFVDRNVVMRRIPVIIESLQLEMYNFVCFYIIEYNVRFKNFAYFSLTEKGLWDLMPPEATKF